MRFPVIRAARIVLGLALLMLCLQPARAETGREVRFGLFLTSLNDVEPGDGSFGAAGFAWFVDPAGTFDPATDMELLGRDVSIEPFVQSRQADGSLYSVVRFRATVDHDFDVARYPFDHQRLVLRFEAAETWESLRLVPDRQDSQISADVRLPGWQLGALTLEATERTYSTGFGHRSGAPRFSRVTAAVEISRTVSPLLFEKFTGLLVAVVIAALVLLVPVEELGTRIGMTTGAIFAAVVNRYRLEDAIGYDAAFGTVDQVTLVTFAMILGILLLSLIAHLRWRRAGDRAGHAAAVRLDRRVGLGLVGLAAAALTAVFALALS
ncbi:hypothetical protein V8J36_06480 [Frigidibacter sp. MR17.14]|uniref:hypothetical protein n=1 Tax=Frigidibacter sp. MR17.14 TaxID=3126509 RepID=UPI0030131D8E